LEHQSFNQHPSEIEHGARGRVNTCSCRPQTDRMERRTAAILPIRWAGCRYDSRILLIARIPYIPCTGGRIGSSANPPKPWRRKHFPTKSWSSTVPRVTVFATHGPTHLGRPLRCASRHRCRHSRCGGYLARTARMPTERQPRDWSLGSNSVIKD